MARQPISEYRAKTIFCQSLNIPYSGIQITSDIKTDKSKISKLPASQRYVLKIDQGIKKRGKQGLITLNLTPVQITKENQKFIKRGYSQFLVEPFFKHQQSDEHYLSLNRTREGIEILYSPHGGINIEDNPNSIQKFSIKLPIDNETIEQYNNESQLPNHLITQLPKIITAFNENHFSFLEINPLLIKNNQLTLLDLAVEVDTAAQYFVNSAWTESDFVYGLTANKSNEELAIDKLAKTSPASLKFDLINPNGSLWMLLSGGGASIVLADEVCDLGHGQQLANYGEYSGNPNAQETYIYTKSLLSLLLKSQSKQKSLIIAGGVANFTDVRKTFTGIIQALDKYKQKLNKQKVKTYVRRGGPYQEQGLSLMTDFLKKSQLYGHVAGPELTLTEIIAKAIKT